MSFTEINSAFSLAGQGLQKLKQAYDFTREGAQIGFLQGKFDRLSQSIGTTSDALMDDLRTATRGTLSDMELMASVTDLVGLGLVKTSKDAVRLSTVVAGLGMNMNQLVLTLSNQTTMRFDQLGVAVVGFDDKVKALKESGMDANSAFTEAFLQQAEQQLVKVGNAADTPLGKFQQLEAQTKNLTDSMKIMAAELAGPAVSALAKSGQTADHYRDVLGKVNPELEKQFNATGHLTGAMRDAVAEYDHARAVGDYYTAMLDAQSGATKNNTDLVRANTEANKAHNDALAIASDSNKQFISDLEDVSAMNKQYSDGLKEADAALAAGKMTAEEHAAAVADLAKEYDSASKRIVASMLEMKYMADGVFTEQEMNSYIGGLEKLGIITQEDANKTRDLMVEASLLEPAFSNASKGAGDLTLNTQRLKGQSAQAVGTVYSMNSALENLAEKGAKEADGAVHGAAMAVHQLNGLSADAYIDIWVREHGHIPTNLGGTQGNGSSVQTGTGTANRASGGPLSRGYTIVGDAPGGIWTSTTEVITPWGYVMDAKTSRKMRDAGLLSDAENRFMSGPIGTNAGNIGGATPNNIPITPPKKGSTGSRVGGGGGGASVILHNGASVSVGGSMGGGTPEQATAVMAAAMQQQTAATDTTNKLLKQLIAKTPGANDVGYAVASNTQSFK